MIGALLLDATAVYAQDRCTALQFTAGRSSITVKGVAPAEEVVCYTLAVRPGQTVNLYVTGRNMMMSVIDVGDDRVSWTFRAATSQVKFVVAQEMRSATPENYTLTAAVR